MKKTGKAILCAAVLMAAIPFSAPVPARAGSCVTQVIGTRGSRTYMGIYDAWAGKKWDPDNFTDVTGEDVDDSGPLIIRGGTVGNVTLSGGIADLTVYGGSVADVQCDGSIDVFGGSTGSLSSEEDVSIHNGAVRGNVEARKAVTLIGRATISGEISGNDVNVYATGATGYVTVSGTVSFSGVMTLTGSSHSFAGLDGQSSGTLKISGFAGELPAITGTEGICMEAGSTASVDSDLGIHTLTLADGSDFAAFAKLAADTVTGPGIVTVHPGSLTVNSGVSNFPMIDFYGGGADGLPAFSAKSGAVSAGGVLSFGYGFIKHAASDGTFDSFALRTLSGNGVSLNTPSAVLKEGKSVSVKASVTPGLSRMAEGTQLCWKLIDPYSAFSITPNPSEGSCEIHLQDSLNTKPPVKADLAVYLADRNGNLLQNYKSALCTVTVS